MGLQKKDKEFRLPKISYLDFKQIEMDRVLTALFARINHNGYPSRLSRSFEIKTEEFRDEFLEHPEWFEGFDQYADVVERWIDTHLMDVVNRGRPNQAIAAPRPLHGYTYRFRNPKRSRDYGASQHLYELFYHARAGNGAKALEHLKRFFFAGIDATTDKYDPSVVVDVETQALLRLSDQVLADAPDLNARDIYPPLCVGAADLLADDVLRLLIYQRFMPRSVMVEYLKILLGFHLALYHLRLFKLLPALVERHGSNPTCAPHACPMNPRDVTDPHGDCPYRIGLLVDVANVPGSPIAERAEHSADIHYRRIPRFVQAYFTVKKLDEFAEYLRRRGKLSAPSDGSYHVGEVLRLLEPPHKAELEKYFGMRLASLIEDTSGGTGDLDPDVDAIAALGLPEFQAYIECLVALRGRFHRQYVTECIDSLLLKNRDGALIAQPRVRNAPRRFILDSRLLEVLLQIAVLRPGGTLGYHTTEIRIEELLTFLRERYGLYVDRLPPGDGFSEPSITDREALRANLDAFRERLREIGFYRDLSDAYFTQTVSPRYTINPESDV